MERARLLRIAYLFLLSATGFFLPVSVWMLSVFIISLAAFWILTGGFFKIRKIPNHRRSIFVFILIYAVYLAGMLITEDFRSGMQELRIMLPVIVFPVIIGLSEPLQSAERKLVISSFIAGVVFSSLAGTGSFLLRDDKVYSDPREISIFISHVRLSLMTVLAIFYSVWYFRESYGKRKWNLLYLLTAAWLTLFLFILLSLTGIILFLIILCISAVILILRSGKRTGPWMAMAAVVLISAAVIFPVRQAVRSFFIAGTAYPEPLEKYTPGSRLYSHDTLRGDRENGNLVWIYLNEDELREGWNGVSTLDYDSHDRMGQDVRYTLIRYLTSKGLRKDSLGVASLDSSDITNIENGLANIIYAGGRPIRARLYEIIWQVDYYIRGGNPSGHSLTQRLEFLKTGWHIFLRSPLLGTGTGDQGIEFRYQYEADRSILDTAFRLEAHNQYLTFLISFGAAGLMIILLSIFYPFIKMKGYNDYMALVFMVIILLSMFSEDTLETHTGVSFFAYFYAVLIFGKDE